MVISDEELKPYKSKQLRFLISEYNRSVDKVKVRIPKGTKIAGLKQIVKDNFSYNDTNKQFKHKSGRFTMRQANILKLIAQKQATAVATAPARKLAKEKKRDEKIKKEALAVKKGMALGELKSKAKAKSKAQPKKTKEMATQTN